jgi:hypothetical protein
MEIYAKKLQRNKIERLKRSEYEARTRDHLTHPCADNDRVLDFALLDHLLILGRRQHPGLLYRHNNLIAQASSFPRASQGFDALRYPGSRVVNDKEHSLHLNHDCGVCVAASAGTNLTE